MNIKLFKYILKRMPSGHIIEHCVFYSSIKTIFVTEFDNLQSKPMSTVNKELTRINLVVD